MVYSIEITDNATQMLTDIRDRRIRRLLAARIDSLASEPEKQGRPLGGLLPGRRSCRAVGQRYRLIYRIDEALVTIVAVGLRRAGDRDDVYALAERLTRLGLL